MIYVKCRSLLYTIALPGLRPGLVGISQVLARSSFLSKAECCTRQLIVEHSRILALMLSDSSHTSKIWLPCSYIPNRMHHAPQNFCFDPSYGARTIGRNEFLPLAQILFDIELVLFHEMTKAYVINGARGCHLFDDLSHYTPLLFGQDLRCRGINLIHDMILIHIFATRTEFCSQWRPGFFAIYRLFLNMFRSSSETQAASSETLVWPSSWGGRQ